MSAATTTPPSTRDAVVEMIRKMPDDPTLADIMDALLVRQKIEEGIRQANAGQTVPHDEAVKRLAKWRHR
jgi:predicted transcriptional regulator